MSSDDGEIDLRSLMVPLKRQGKQPPPDEPDPQKRGRKKLYASPTARQQAYRDRKKVTDSLATEDHND